MEKELEWLNPDLTIVALYADNDYGDLIRNKIYKLNDQRRLINNNYQLGDTLLKEMGNAQQPEEAKGLRTASMLNTFIQRGEDPASNNFLPIRFLMGVYRTLRDSVELILFGVQVDNSWPVVSLKVLNEEYSGFVEEGNNEVNNLFGDRYDVDIAVKPHSKSSQYKMELMQQVLARISGITVANKSPLLLIIIPSPIDVCENYDYQINKTEFPNYEPSRLTAFLEKSARMNDIDFVNLYPFFKQRDDTDTLYFGYGDDHWNEKGQAVAAELVADKILSKGYLDNYRPNSD